MIRRELKQLIFHSVKLLGEAFCEIHGKEIFTEIENLRLEMKKVRGKEEKIVHKSLSKLYHKLKTQTTDELHQKARAFALMLELINTCEVAFRSHRLLKYDIKEKTRPEALIYVFTSHPTESRSQNFLRIMNQIEQLLMKALEENFETIREKLFYLLKIAIRINLANNRKPLVKDEMEQIFHTVLEHDILKEQIRLNKKKFNISFRTWVGGDKDGHPKVGSQTMLQSWSLSRSKLLFYLQDEIKVFEQELALFEDGICIKNELERVKHSLRSLKIVQKGDGKKILLLKKQLERLRKVSEKAHLVSPFLTDFEKLLWHYPALVLPLEIREDSELIRKAQTDRYAPIVKMLQTLREISQGMNPKWYVRGFVISMCMSSEDILAAIHITRKVFKKLAIPVVPLFENEKGLLYSNKILEGAFKGYPLQEEHMKRWRSHFEVMVGYSDSSKENGVLPARLMIEEGLYRLEKYLLGKKLRPVFFHGSGGSTSRGGGSISEQISWWPQSALNVFKVTIQGEMVQRNFTNSLIMRSQIGKVVEGYSKCCPVLTKKTAEISLFSDHIQKSYRKLLGNPSFQELTRLATPYDYLNLLKIGSRPSKRSTKGVFSLRAIPWILCWTQTRLLLPVWWGTGSAWESLSKKEKVSLQAFAEHSPLMQSYIKNLGFTLAKIELGVWNFHLMSSELSGEEKERWKKTLSKELALSKKFFKEISGHENLTWFRPWLGESIYFRSSMIHPLNVIQKLALERKDHVLLRETVTGIASGMLTTG